VNRAAAGAGVPYSSAAVVTTGPALLVSFWSGDGASGDHDANPDANWTKFGAVNRPGASYIQGAAAYRQVNERGTFWCNWTTPISSEGGIIFLGALQA
jgi:hypothetical protein